MPDPSTPQHASAGDLFDALFGKELRDDNLYDQDVVKLVSEHLGKPKPHSQAGARLAEDLIGLAKVRAGQSGS